MEFLLIQYNYFHRFFFLSSLKNDLVRWFEQRAQKTQTCYIIYTKSPYKMPFTNFDLINCSRIEEQLKILLKENFLNEIQPQLNPTQELQFSQQLTFSTTYKFKSCSVTQNGKVIENNTGGWYCCMCDQIIPKNNLIQFAFKIIKLGSGIMIGIGFRDIVQSIGYFNCFSIGRGTYNIHNSGYCQNHDQQDKDSKQIAFQFSTNDIIIVEVDIEKKYVKWIKQSTNESFTLAIHTSKELYPCVHIINKSKVEISNQVIK
ncbi:unnamed protein product [Paramecium sonneborni]|uniref:Uncharacterized protein n=1 Tax=Paramecium sonneborni TaxID=65129 RepID=A0A8S1M8B3_9CILI|nr:unnamed protein product [Paramecium sonneborni]